MKEMRDIIEKLNAASKAYYQEDREIISDMEYDALYDTLLDMEKRTGIVYNDSPTIRVGYQVVSSLEKYRHQEPMLSLNKTKDKQEVKDFIKDPAILSWKLDGLTIVLEYRQGYLDKAITRGDGFEGEIITHNARVFANLPAKIAYKGDLILRGEAVIKYKDFKRINKNLPLEMKYKNPRNLVSGTVRQLDNKVTWTRRVYFYAFSLVSLSKIGGKEEVKFSSKTEQLEYLKNLGFDIVEYIKVTSDNVVDKIEEFEAKIAKNPFTTDGLVITFDNIELSRSLGTTSKFPRDSLAFKWTDDIKETRLIDIEWSPSRTGLINPIAIFEPVEIEGTTVKRASLHNISILKDLKLGIGDRIEVYKANMIIPQVRSNLTASDNISIPSKCPICLQKTKIREDNGVMVLICTNSRCPAKRIKSFVHFVGRNAINIIGINEATIEKLINHKIINKFKDIFHISNHKEEILKIEGFGEKSYNSLIMSIEEARKTYLANFIYSLGINGIGLSNAKLLAKNFNNNLEAIIKASYDEIINIDGFGPTMANTIVEYFSDPNQVELIESLSEEFDFLDLKTSKKVKLENKSFVITGNLKNFENRKELIDLIERNGGNVRTAVSKNTDYLINNDINSTSSKNRRAISLNIPIINEEDLLKMI